MAKEVGFIFPDSNNLYFFVIDAAGDYYNGGGFENYNAGNYGNYDIGLTEDGSAGVYFGTFPAVADGTYTIVFYLRAGGAPAEGDTPIGSMTVAWDGTTLRDSVDVEAWEYAAVASPTNDGVPEVDLTHIGGDANSLTRLKRSVDAVLVGVVVADGANNATTFLTDLTTENDDYYGDGDGGSVIAFIGGTTNQYQTRRIVASSTSGADTSITLEKALDATPAGSDAFIILGRITELS